MDRARQMRAWSERLAAAAQAGDWATLAAVDRAVAAGVPRLLADGQWEAVDRSAFLALEAAHAKACRTVGAARAALGQRLAEMAEQQDALRAYGAIQAREALA